MAVAQFRVLVVDDEACIRDTRAMLLKAAGYEVSTAKDGFDALLQLKDGQPPHLVISDLNMPNMSGFEFLSVLRRRFPQIAVIASSGAYQQSEHVPGGVLADAFHVKNGQSSSPATLLAMVANLLSTPAERILAIHTGPAPVWIPRNGRDSRGLPFIVITCPDCQRSFPLSLMHEGSNEVQEVECLFCPTTVRFIVDFSRDVHSPTRPPTTRKPSLVIAASAGLTRKLA
jgi:CheY-like chemotaxis protein